MTYCESVVVEMMVSACLSDTGSSIRDMHPYGRFAVTYIPAATGPMFTLHDVSTKPFRRLAASHGIVASVAVLVDAIDDATGAGT